MMRGLAAAAFVLALSSCSGGDKPHEMVSAPAGEWIKIFNGKDLADWTVKIAGHDLNDNYRDTYRVENGVLKVSYQQYDKFGGRFGSIFYNKKLSHYWLHAEYRFVGDQAAGAPSWAYKNSGLQLHSQAPETMRKAQEFPVSVEFDIVGGRFWGHHPTGDVCKNGSLVSIGGVPLAGKCSKLSTITIPGDEWVTVEAEVDGSRRVRQIVNGVLVVEYTDLKLDDKDPDALRLLPPGGDPALSSGYISIQANSHPIEFRRIDIMPVGP